MGREIRFRVWCKEHKLMSTPSFMDCKGGKIVDVVGSKCTGNGFVLNRGHWTNCFELMQFTGHKDKNGKKIFEGDILEGEGGYVASVVWDVELARWALSDWDIDWHNPDDRSRIIGNIHEHPHLLEKL